MKNKTIIEIHQFSDGTIVRREIKDGEKRRKKHQYVPVELLRRK